MDSHAIPLSNAAPGDEALDLTWRQPAGLVSLSFVNLALKIVTLGVYVFWAKTEVRKRLWSAVRINGEPLAYTGTGKELLVGFLFIFALVLLPSFLVVLAAFLYFGPESTGADLAQAALYLVFLALWGLAIYRAQRYRLSRTVWRGIRGGMAGNGRRYAWTFFWTALLVPFTLGWIIPWRQTKLQGLLVNDMRFGSGAFAFAAPAGPLYKPFAVLWVVLFLMVLSVSALVRTVLSWQPTALSPEALREFQWMLQAMFLAIFAAGYVVYAVAGAWYRAYQTNHFAAHTRFAGANLKGSLRPGGLMAVSLVSFLMTVGTLGILAPVAQARVWRYIVEHLEIDGHAAMADIAQGADQGYTRGEGLAQAFDFDAV